ncbi:MAG: DUF1508 domain-containing protein [Clostridia bacterium]|nr:DUF1508 domain-containing protein [Clostridia bacterium]
MLEWIKNLCQTIGEKVNLSANTVMWIGLGVIVLVLILIVVLIAVAVKKRKKKKQLKAKETLNVVEVKPEPVIEEKVVEQELVQADTLAEEQVVAEQPEKKEEKKQTKKAPAKKTVEKPVKKLNGKWTVEIKRAGEFVSKLTASNGEVMLYSETYTTQDGARNGIMTIIKGLESGKVVLYQDKNENYYFKVKTANNRLLCVGEIYKSKDQCLKAIDTVKRIAPTSSISPELVESERYIEYTPALIDESKKTMRGKWKIEETEDGKFVARLYASNGQLMLSTEEVANKKTAENAIESVKKNAKDGNFIIDRDKFKRYYYKLRNAQKSVICIGEAYESLDSCVSAIESVRRFALYSNVVR